MGDGSFLDFRNWSPIDVEALSANAREKYLLRRRAVVDYLRHVPTQEIEQNTGLSRSEVYRLARRCFQPHEDGTVQGFRALIPGRRLRPFGRKQNLDVGSKGGGLLTTLLEQYPAVGEAVRKEYLGKSSQRSLGRRPPLKAIHRLFLDACLKAGVPPDQYPFNTVKQGREALRVHLRAIEDLDPAGVARVRGGKGAGKHWLATGPSPSASPPFRPFAVVELDGHKVDLRCTVDVEGPDVNRSGFLGGSLV